LKGLQHATSNHYFCSTLNQMKRFLPVIIAMLFFSCQDNESPAGTKDPTDSTLATRLPITKPSPNPYVDVDLSPMDMSYYPANYPKLEMDDSIRTGPTMRIIYSRPHKEGRVIFGGLQKYGSYWRLGANEATEIEFFQPVSIQGKKINTGRYIIYCIPYEDKWTIVLNKNNFTWGLKADVKKDLLRFDIPIKKISPPVEYLSILFQDNGNGADLVMAWDDVEARLPINL
jgi:hypothetical protein